MAGRLDLTPFKDLLPIPLRAMLHWGVDRHGLEKEAHHAGWLGKGGTPWILDPNHDTPGTKTYNKIPQVHTVVISLLGDASFGHILLGQRPILYCSLSEGKITGPPFLGTEVLKTTVSTNFVHKPTHGLFETSIQNAASLACSSKVMSDGCPKT